MEACVHHRSEAPSSRERKTRESAAPDSQAARAVFAREEDTPAVE